MPHMLGDAVSQFIFLNSWATVARWDRIDIPPPFGSASIFPPRNIPGFDLSQWVFKEKIVTKPFVFEAFALSTLKNKYSKNGEMVSRAQALCAFILSRIMATLYDHAKDNRYMVINSVNVRPLLDPPVPKQFFGSIGWMATTLIDSTTKEDEIEKKLKVSLRDVNPKSMKKVQNGELTFTKETFMESIKGEIVRYSFSSLCNYPVYDVDFGWGKPKWVTTCGMIFDNLVICMDTKEGRGIEAWICLTEENMAKFEKDEQLLSYISSTDRNGNPNFNSRL